MDDETKRQLEDITAHITELETGHKTCLAQVSLAVFQIDHHMTKLALAVSELKDALVDR